MRKIAVTLAVAATMLLSEVSYASAADAGLVAARVGEADWDVLPIQYYGPGSGTGMGRYYGPGSGTGMGRCRPVRVRVCGGGFGDGRGPRCWFERQMRCN